MSDNERRNLNADVQSLNVSLGSLLTARNNLIYQETTEGSFDDAAHAELESEVRTMYEELIPYRDHQAVAETWEEFSLDAIPRLCAQRREVSVDSANGFGINSGRTEVQVEHAPVDYLIGWARAFTIILKKLGLTVPVKHSIDTNDISQRDLAALLEQRGQTDALENANVD